MPPAAALRSSLWFSHHKPTQPSVSHQEITTSLTAPKPKSLLHKHPLYTPTNAKISTQFKEKILCLEVMGIDTGRALSTNPSLHSASLDSINSIICFLRSKGIYHKDLQRIFGMCPQVLTANIGTDLIPVYKFLKEDLKVPDNNFRMVINKCPRLLTSSVRDQLKPALFYLQRLGFKDLHVLAYQEPVLLVSNVEKTLIPKLKFLESIGMSRDEAVEMVLRCPALFTFSIENNFKPKYQYFVEEIEGNLEELKEFPQYFAFSLEKRIKPRHVEVMQNGVKMSLSLVLKTTDEQFKELIRGMKNGNSD